MPPFFEQIEELQGVKPGIAWAMFIVACLIVVVALVSIAISIWLAIKYVTYNRRKNSAGMMGSEVARKILDDNGLQHIKVSVVGSMVFGNSYSHYFKKVRLRRLTNKKTSITSLAMGAEKASLAVLDKEGDPDMKKRVALTPVMYFGPVAFIPIVLIGVVLDFIVLGGSGVITTIFSFLGLAFYAVSFVLSVMVLKTEVKAQGRAIEILRADNLATSEELDMMKELFKLYNIQYINDIILEMLELIMRVLQLVAKLQQGSSSND